MVHVKTHLPTNKGLQKSCKTGLIKAHKYNSVSVKMIILLFADIVYNLD